MKQKIKNWQQQLQRLRTHTHKKRREVYTVKSGFNTINDP